jgi:hypothetical protein
MLARSSQRERPTVFKKAVKVTELLTQLFRQEQLHLTAINQVT